MRLTHKLTALLVFGNCTVLTGYGWFTRQREVDMFERTMERDTFLAGSTLLATVESSWRNHGRQEAMRLIAHANDLQKDMFFRWLSAADLTETPLRTQAIERVRRGERAFERSEGALYMYVPFAPPSGGAGVLEVTKAMDRDEAYVQSSTAILVGATAASILVSGLLAFLIGTTLVGRPMELLVERVERVGGGNLSGHLRLARSDEIGLLGTALDQMAADLQETSAKAEAEAAARRATLRQLRHAERLATVGTLAAGVAHELGTPLNVVLARAKLIDKWSGEPEKVRRHAEIIREQTQRMTRIIRQLMDFARRGESEKSLRDLRLAVVRVLDTLQSLADQHAVSLRLAESAEAWIKADPGQLEQVLTNLVMNAIHASPPGKTVQVTLREVLHAPLPEHGGPLAPHWSVEVRDEGPGVPEDLRQRIFEPFFTTKDVGEGTGLGLTVAHGIVAEHDGWITISSEQGSGCTFSIFLPAVEPAAEDQA